MCFCQEQWELGYYYSQPAYEEEGDGSSLSCDLCNYTSKTRFNLTRHMQSQHAGIEYKCDHCQYVTTSQWNLTRHTQTKHKPCATDTELDDKEISYERKMYACDFCDYVSNYTYNIRRHKQLVHEITDCSNQTISGNQDRTGHSSREYPCDQCEYVSKNSSNLKRHKNFIHGKDKSVISAKKYSCDQCEYVTNDSSNFKRHKWLVHEKQKYKAEKTYPCDKCDYVTSERKDLIRHKRREHVPKVECDICKGLYSSKGALKTHKKAKHSQDPLSFDGQMGQDHTELNSLGFEITALTDIKTEPFEEAMGYEISAAALEPLLVLEEQPDLEEEQCDGIEEQLIKQEPDENPVHVEMDYVKQEPEY